MLELAVFTGYPEDGRENLSSTCLPSNLLPGVIFNKARFSANKAALLTNKLTFPDLGWLSRNYPSPLTQIFGKAFAERDWEAVRGSLDPSLTLHWPLTHAASCSSLFRREQLQRHTLSLVKELWVRKERTASPSGKDWQFALMRLLTRHRAQTVRADEPIAISEG